MENQLLSTNFHLHGKTVLRCSPKELSESLVEYLTEDHCVSVIVMGGSIGTGHKKQDASE